MHRYYRCLSGSTLKRRTDKHQGHPFPSSSIHCDNIGFTNHFYGLQTNFILQPYQSRAFATFSSSERLQDTACLSPSSSRNYMDSSRTLNCLSNSLGEHYVSQHNHVLEHRKDRFYSQLGIHVPSRSFHSSVTLLDIERSKVEQAVKALKSDKKDDTKKGEEVAKKEKTPVIPQPEPKKPATPDTTVAKKSLRQRIWAEVVHYYHGFRLLFLDIRICMRYLRKVTQGQTLTRRERRQVGV